MVNAKANHDLTMTKFYEVELNVYWNGQWQEHDTYSELSLEYEGSSKAVILHDNLGIELFNGALPQLSNMEIISEANTHDEHVNMIQFASIVKANQHDELACLQTPRKPAHLQSLYNAMKKSAAQ